MICGAAGLSAAMSLLPAISLASGSDEPVKKTVISGPGEAVPKPKHLAPKQDLAAKREEMKSLEARATTVTKSLGELAASGKIPQDAEALKLMQEMLDELKAIRERLDKMQADIDRLNGIVEGQKESLTGLSNDVTSLKAHKEGNYVQFQFQDTNQKGGATDAFRMRRVRLGFTDTISPSTSFKVSFDLATGTNQTQAQLRDAFLTYIFEKSSVGADGAIIMGQQNMPLGYEIERSSTAREFPERARYNQVMMNGERGRGVVARQGLGEHALAYIGAFNSLTINDPEQANLAPAPESKLGVAGGLRFFGPKYDIGISGFVSERPSFTSGSPAQTSPETDRQFLYIDGSYVGLFDPNLFIRAEAMLGKDRVPNATANPTREAHDMAGYHVILGYNLNPRNQIALRYEQFDPNLDAGGNLFSGWGISYNYFINSKARLTLAYEAFVDEARAASLNQTRYHFTTLRMQYRF